MRELEHGERSNLGDTIKLLPVIPPLSLFFLILFPSFFPRSLIPFLPSILIFTLLANLAQSTHRLFILSSRNPRLRREYPPSEPHRGFTGASHGLTARRPAAHG